MNEKSAYRMVYAIFPQRKRASVKKTNMAEGVWRICTKKTVNSVNVNEFFRWLEICRRRGCGNAACGRKMKQSGWCDRSETKKEECV